MVIVSFERRKEESEERYTEEEPFVEKYESTNCTYVDVSKSVIVKECRLE